MMRFFAVGILSATASGMPEDGEALSLLQMSSVKVSGSDFHSSNKDCKAAKKAAKDAKTKVKTDKSAIKAAKAALKAAKAAKEESEKAKEAADGEALEACPVPEVDEESPDEGCSATAVTSARPGGRQDFFDGVNCNPKYINFANQIGFEECLGGGGVKQGDGKPYGDKLGIAIMQPCSVAWTNGGFISPKGTLGDGKRAGEVMYQEKSGVRSHCECVEWANSVAPWPASIAVTFYAHGSRCRLHKKTTIPWKDFGPAMYLSGGANDAFTCYLGNPAAWKRQYQEEKAANQLIDKCSKPEWSRWYLKAADVNGVPKGQPSFKSLWTGSGINGGVINIKECYKVAKATPECADAVALTYDKSNNGWCKCIFQTANFEGNTRGNIDNWVCLL